MLKKACISALLVAIMCGVGMAEEDQAIEPSMGPGLQPVSPTSDAVFQPIAVDPVLVRKSMQARAEYDRMNREIIAYKTKLFQDNAELQELQTQMRELQSKIDAILEADGELTSLKAQQQEIAPELPGTRPFPLASPPNPSATDAPAKNNSDL